MLEEAKVWVKMKPKFLQQPEVLVVQGTFPLLHTLQFAEQTRTCNPNRSAPESLTHYHTSGTPAERWQQLKTSSSAPQGQDTLQRSQVSEQLHYHTYDDQN